MKRPILVVVTFVLFVVLFIGGVVFAQTQQTEGTLKVPDAAQFVGAPKGTPLTGEALFKRTNQVGQLLRCPVCQGMAISDSPAEMAVNMKGQVRELLARGYTEEQILKYFELSYGQFVLLKPKMEGVTGLVWVLPVLALVLGAVVVFFKLRKLEQAQPPTGRSSTTEHQPPATDDPYLNRVRDLVSGGKK
ncbi:MAG: cytochrome c-type biogenesis protein [Thermoanaerobaculia bacterium]